MSKQNINDEILVDYVENENSPSLQEDVKLCLGHSLQDRETVKALKVAKKLLKHSDSEEPPFDDKFYDVLHSKIMAAVEEEKVMPGYMLKMFESKYRRMAAFTFIFLFISVALVYEFKSNKLIHVKGEETAQGDWLLSVSVDRPEAFANSLISDEDKTDFFLNAAAEKVGLMRASDAKKFMDEVSNSN